MEFMQGALERDKREGVSPRERNPSPRFLLFHYCFLFILIIQCLNPALLHYLKRSIIKTKTEEGFLFAAQTVL